eukprot:jgi/Mesen1/10548/ME000083S10060
MAAGTSDSGAGPMAVDFSPRAEEWGQSVQPQTVVAGSGQRQGGVHLGKHPRAEAESEMLPRSMSDLDEALGRGAPSSYRSSGGVLRGVPTVIARWGAMGQALKEPSEEEGDKRRQAGETGTPPASHFSSETPLLLQTEAAGATRHAGSAAAASFSEDLLQSFGCLLLVEEETFRVLAISENVLEVLELAAVKMHEEQAQVQVQEGQEEREDLPEQQGQELQEEEQGVREHGQEEQGALRERGEDFRGEGANVGELGGPQDRRSPRGTGGSTPPPPPPPQWQVALGMDARELLTPASIVTLERAVCAPDLTVVSPIVVNLRRSGRAFYAIMHRLDVGLMVDFEELQLGGSSGSRPGPSASASASASGSGSTLTLLCCLGVSRRIFMDNRVRMIVDAQANSVRVLPPGSLAGAARAARSTLRGVQGESGCPSKGGTPAGGRADGSRRLWGLVVFGEQLNKEMELATQMKAREILRTKSLLGEMLLGQPPLALVTSTPNLTDLVRCDGGALLFRGRCWRLGQAPSERQVADLAEWLLTQHPGSAGFSTDSLEIAEYPRAAELQDVACGLVAVKFSERDFVMWVLGVRLSYAESGCRGRGRFDGAQAAILRLEAGVFRAKAAREIKWGGAKQPPVAAAAAVTSPQALGASPSGKQQQLQAPPSQQQQLHPRSSFKAWLEVVDCRSRPWDDVEMDAVHSLQLILCTALQARSLARSLVNESDVSVEIKLSALDQSSQLALHEHLKCVPVEEAMGKSLLRDMVAEESQDIVEHLLQAARVRVWVSVFPVECLDAAHALRGHEESGVEVQLKVMQDGEPAGIVHMLVNSCAHRDMHNRVVGVCLVGQGVATSSQNPDADGYMQGQSHDRADSPATTTPPHVHAHNPNPNPNPNPGPLVPPVFGMDESGLCSEWNVGMARLSGLAGREVMGKRLLGQVFGPAAGPGPEAPALLALGNWEALAELEGAVKSAMEVEDEDPASAVAHPLAFVAKDGSVQEVLLTVNKRTDAEGHATGVLCFLHAMMMSSSGEGQARASTAAAAPGHQQHAAGPGPGAAGGSGGGGGWAQSEYLALARENIRAPLDGISLLRSSLEQSGAANLTSGQRRVLETVSALEEQIKAMLLDMEDPGAVEGGHLVLQHTDFSLLTMVNAALSQGSSAAIAKSQRLQSMVPPGLPLRVFGDPTRLQQVLATFVRTAVAYTPPTGWIQLWVERMAPRAGGLSRNGGGGGGGGGGALSPQKPASNNSSIVKYRFSVTHSGEGIPAVLVQALVGNGGAGLMGIHAMGLKMCRNVVQLMGGELGYSYETGQSSFKVEVDLTVKLETDSTAHSIS